MECHGNSLDVYYSAISSLALKAHSFLNLVSFYLFILPSIYLHYLPQPSILYCGLHWEVLLRPILELPIVYLWCHDPLCLPNGKSVIFIILVFHKILEIS